MNLMTNQLISSSSHSIMTVYCMHHACLLHKRWNIEQTNKYITSNIFYFHKKKKKKNDPAHLIPEDIRHVYHVATNILCKRK